jgi:hypothetical protein
VEVHHLAMSEIYGELNLISAKVRPMKWADQKIRETLVMMAATVADQPQHDLSCAETSQSCKQCSCPKNLLHDPPPDLPPRRGSEVRNMVRNAALKGILPNTAVRCPVLFTEQVDKVGCVRWVPTKACSPALYEKVRSQLGGIHLVNNSQWELLHYDYLVQSMKDSMHGQEHGTCMKMLDGTVIVVCELQRTLKLRSDVLIKRLFQRLYQLCISSKTQWITMLRMSNQKVMKAMKLFLTNARLRMKGKRKSDTTDPMCDANDVLKAMLAMPFVLDDLAKDELEAFNSTVTNPRDRLKNPFPGMIVTYNDYLHWYMLYRAKALTEPEIQRMDDMSLALLKRLVKTFPHGVTLKDGSFRSAFCTEKPHSIVHSGDNYRMMGRCKNYNTVAPETRHKETKMDAHKTNNQATVGSSILMCNLDAEADRRLTWLHDRRGMRSIHNNHA